MSARSRIALGSLFMFLPASAYANGGLPIIFLVNTYAFVVGTVLVLALETIYLKRVFTGITTKEIFACVFKFNLLSGLFGAIVIPILILIVQLDPILYMVRSDTKESTMTVVWWSSFSLDLLMAYAATVFIEYKVLKKAAFTDQLGNSKALLGHVVKFNILSYLVLVILVAITIANLSGQ